VTPAASSFTTELGFRGFFGDAPGHGDIQPFLCAPGTDVALSSALLTLADNDLGAAITRANLPFVSFTSTLSVALVARPELGRFDSFTMVLHNGGTMATGEVRFADAGGTCFALAHGTFVRSPNPQDVLTSLDPSAMPCGDRLTRPLAERCGCRVTAPGEAVVELRPDLLNAGGFLHGGVHAILAETAVLSLDADRHRDQHEQPGVAVDLAVHYLRSARRGPFRAVAEPVGVPAGLRRYRVEVVDLGRDGRVTSIVTVTCADLDTLPSVARNQQSLR
jgi:uncharacterized protein (TIGR00369 family)